jgi:hypothetical protein
VSESEFANQSIGRRQSENLRCANVVFLHTTVDDGDALQQILAWTLKSRWQKQNQLLREVTTSIGSEK